MLFHSLTVFVFEILVLSENTPHIHPSFIQIYQQTTSMVSEADFYI